MIKVFVNDKPVTLPDGATLEQAMQTLADRPARMAVALNGRVIPNSQWSSEQLANNDHIDLFQLVAGG